MVRREAGSAAGRDTGAARRPSRRPTALFVVIAVACVAVPAVFTTRIQAVFVVPKLGVLWGLLAICMCLAAFQAFFAPQPPRLRPVWAVDAAVVSFLGLTTLAWIFSSDGEQSLYGERLQHQGLLATLLYVAWFYVARIAISDVGDLRRLLAFVAAGGALVAGLRAGAEGGTRSRLGRLPARAGECSRRSASRTPWPRISFSSFHSRPRSRSTPDQW